MAKKQGGSRWVAVSGGFDPIHIGHVRMLREAKKLGDKLVVIVNNDNWLQSKKGYVFMDQRERVELIKSFPCVDKVVLTKHAKNDTDRSVCRELEQLKPAVFANGGDRRNVSDIPEARTCKEIGAKMVFNVGSGGKVQSSSWMVRDAARNFARSVRPWGEFYNWDKGRTWNLKTIYVGKGKRLSLQYHHKREEWWLLLEGDATAIIEDGGVQQSIPLEKGKVLRVGKGQVHRLTSKKGGIIVEVAYGTFDENDIVRLEDDHGRDAKKGGVAAQS